MSNPLTPLPKDIQHSCVFDWPDRALRPDAPPPSGDTPDLWVSPYPYDPLDDWDPTNPLMNGVPGSGVADRPPGPYPLPNVLYAKINTDHASFSTNINIGFWGNGAQSIGFQYSPIASGASSCYTGGAKAAPNTGEARVFAEFANYQGAFGVHADCSGQVSCDYDHTVSGNTLLKMDFWIYEIVSSITEATQDWVFTHSGFTYAAHFEKSVRGFPFSDVFILEFHYHDATRTITFNYD